MTLAKREPEPLIGVWSHLGMTGKWLRRRAREPVPRFARLRVDLDDGAALYYADFDFSAAFVSCPARDSSRCRRSPLWGRIHCRTASTSRRLADRLARTRLPIKVAIMDQTLLPGVGNIQASEGLFRAGIDPRRPARSLSRAELARLARGLLDSIRYTMKTFKESGADGADADIEYVEERRIANPFLVYGRAGERCPRRARGKKAATAERSSASSRPSARRSTARDASDSERGPTGQPLIRSGAARTRAGRHRRSRGGPRPSRRAALLRAPRPGRFSRPTRYRFLTRWREAGR